MLPILNGFDACSLLRKDETTRNIPIIFLSAKNKEKDIEKGLALGANLYVVKPFSTKKLVEQVHELIES